MDFSGPFSNEKYVLVIIYEYSRYLLLEVINNLRTETVTYHLKKIFMEFELPECVKSDNGPPMNGEQFGQFLQAMGIKHKKITPYWPQANGTVERFMRTLGNTIKAVVVEKKSWEEEVDEFLLSYRTTPHTTLYKSNTSIIVL